MFIPKNNINNQADYSEKSLTDYLNLYENFRLKVREAEELKTGYHQLTKDGAGRLSQATG